PGPRGSDGRGRRDGPELQITDGLAAWMPRPTRSRFPARCTSDDQSYTMYSDRLAMAREVMRPRQPIPDAKMRRGFALEDRGVFGHRSRGAAEHPTARTQRDGRFRSHAIAPGNGGREPCTLAGLGRSSRET